MLAGKIQGWQKPFQEKPGSFSMKCQINVRKDSSIIKDCIPVLCPIVFYFKKYILKMSSPNALPPPGVQVIWYRNNMSDYP